jgi:hypothetical protein
MVDIRQTKIKNDRFKTQTYYFTHRQPHTDNHTQKTTTIQTDKYEYQTTIQTKQTDSHTNKQTYSNHIYSNRTYKQTDIHANNHANRHTNRQPFPLITLSHTDTQKVRKRIKATRRMNVLIAS